MPHANNSSAAGIPERAAIQRFEIRGLHGYRNITIPFQENRLILVGENGAGKTTVLRLFYYLLSGRIDALSRYRFDTLTLHVDGKPYCISHPRPSRGQAEERASWALSLPPEFRSLAHIEALAREKGLSRSQVMRYLAAHGARGAWCDDDMDFFGFEDKKEAKKAEKTLAELSSALGFQVLYLPTYRRIEQELSLIFDGTVELERHRHRQEMLREDGHSYVELIEFGMGDVEKKVKETLGALKEFAREGLNNLTLGYLGDVVDGAYRRVDVDEVRSASVATIESVLGRVDENVLSSRQKQRLLGNIKEIRDGGSIDEHARVVCHYFLKLLTFQAELRKREAQMTKFCEVCTIYMGERKEFFYDSTEFDFSIADRSGRSKEKIELGHLSSGEKQIVSLFCHLYLSGQAKHLVVIDEPELSLSVPWQRRFLLDVSDGEFCAGVVAATHSPFIYENSLRRYAHGLGEFEGE